MFQHVGHTHFFEKYCFWFLKNELLCLVCLGTFGYAFPILRNYISMCLLLVICNNTQSDQMQPLEIKSLFEQLHLIVFCVLALAPCPDLAVTIFRLHVPRGMKFSFNCLNFSILILWPDFLFQTFSSAGLTSVF